MVIAVGVLAPAATAAARASRGARTTAGRQYLALVKPVDAAYATIRQTSGGWVATTCSGTSCNSPAEQPVIAALELCQRGLQRDPWPKGAEPDVKRLIRSIGADVAELQAIDQPNATTWSATSQRDQHAVTVSANLVRGDVGLAATTSL